MRDKVVSLVEFGQDPGLEFQHGVAFFASGQWDVFHRTAGSELAPANGQAGFHCHAKPELAA